MSPQDLTNQLLGRGPQTVRDVAAALLKEGWHPTAVLDQARTCLEYLVAHRKAERVEVGGVRVYRLPGGVPIAPSQAERE